jgi:hypothetical protein
MLVAIVTLPPSARLARWREVADQTSSPSLGGAIKAVERKLAEGTLMHGGRPLMAWCVGNAKVEQRANSILITKQASGTAKIDPLMALFNAVDLMGRQPAAQGDIMGLLTKPGRVPGDGVGGRRRNGGGHRDGPG